MFRAKKRIILLAAALFALAAPAALGQSQQTQQQSSAEDNYVTSKMFQNRVFEIKNRDPQSLIRVLAPLGSGFKGAIMSANADFRTITVRDFPENLAVVEEAIRRFDQPEQARPGIEFRVHFLIASNDAAGSAGLPAELGEVARQLQQSLGYKSFSLLGAQVLRSKEGSGTTHNKGVADLKAPGDTPASKNPVFYSYYIRSVKLESVSSTTAKVIAEEFNLQMKVPLTLGDDKISYQDIGFQSPVSMREGERVVVGTTTIADKSVVVVLSASTVK
ncbi:MAG TPA: secretin N-terminal domain-containing protein [Pyrinomonadaceae bacterium]|jgi:hypothetical protein|nr:secretin N-terminal domain-containing protein [Pyrinomonadaceae bacterium]